MKKSIYLLVVFAFVILLLSGCYTKPSTNENSNSTISSKTNILGTLNNESNETTKTIAPNKEQLALSYDDCKCVGVSLSYYFYAIGYRQNDITLHESVRKTLDNLYEKETIKEISSNWFCDEIFPKEIDYPVKWKKEGEDESWDLIRKKGSIIVGADSMSYPLSYKDSTGQWKGFEIDVIKNVFKELKIDVKFVDVYATNKTEILNNHQVDILWGGFRYDTDNINSIAYSENSEWRLENALCYFCRKADKFAGEIELWEMNEKLGVVSNSFATDLVESRMKTHDCALAIVEYPNTYDAFLALQHEDVFAVACDYLSAYSIL